MVKRIRSRFSMVESLRGTYITLIQETRSHLFWIPFWITRNNIHPATVCIAQICKPQKIKFCNTRYYILSFVWDKQSFLSEEDRVTSLKNLKNHFIRKRSPETKVQGCSVGTCSTRLTSNRRNDFIIWNFRLYSPFTVMHFEIYLILY